MKMIKYFLSFMSGTAIGLIAGYMAGAKRDIYLGSSDPGTFREKENSSHKEIKRELSDLKKKYDQGLDELTDQMKDRLEELKKITEDKE
jgi:hypothetical protein